jgi:hypothetical protein
VRRVASRIAFLVVAGALTAAAQMSVAAPAQAGPVCVLAGYGSIQKEACVHEIFNLE